MVKDIEYPEKMGEHLWSIKVVCACAQCPLVAYKSSLVNQIDVFYMETHRFLNNCVLSGTTCKHLFYYGYEVLHSNNFMCVLCAMNKICDGTHFILSLCFLVELSTGH